MSQGRFTEASRRPRTIENKPLRDVDLPLLREDPCSPMPAGAETQLENATATIISSEDEVAISRYRKGVPIGLV